MRCLVSLVILVPLACAQVPASRPLGRLRIATYNVENLFDNWDDPYRPDEGTSPKSHADLVVLAKTIDGLDADVLALQEVENLGVLGKLNRSLAKPYAFVEALPTNDARGIHVALLSRLAIVRSIGHRHRALANGKRVSRDLPVFEIDAGSGSGLLVSPLHLKSKRSVRGDPGADLQRSAEAAALLGVLRGLRERGFEQPFVALGDLNDEARSAPLAPLFAKLHDATAGVAPGERWSYVYAGRKQQIDHILYDGDVAVLRAGFVHDADDASDHAPVFAEIAWPSVPARVAGPAHRGLGEPHRPRVRADDLERLETFLLAEVAVTGTLVAVRKTRTGGHLQLLLSEERGKAAEGFIHRDAVGRFGDLESLVGSEVELVGPLYRYRSRFEVGISRASQVRRAGR